jgi:hypothetical protein
LPIVEVNKTSIDFIFLLEDGKYMHIEFQTSYKKADLIRFTRYNLRLYERDKREIQTVIIYSSDVRKAADSLKIGSLTYTPTNVMMYEYDGNAIYANLEAKLKSGEDLTDTDMLNLIFLPLMRNDLPKKELAKKSIEMAQTIQDESKRDTCIASTVAFMSKYLNDDEITNILEVLKMTDIFTRLISERMTEREIEIAKKAIKKGISLEDIADLTGIDIDILEDLKQDVEEGNAD